LSFFSAKQLSMKPGYPPIFVSWSFIHGYLKMGIIKE
jgi:hypothetical protein